MCFLPISSPSHSLTFWPGQNEQLSYGSPFAPYHYLRSKLCLNLSSFLTPSPDSKPDVTGMSILVRAKKADLEKDKMAYTTGDKAMMDQAVSHWSSMASTNLMDKNQLTFLGGGHETTALRLQHRRLGVGKPRPYSLNICFWYVWKGVMAAC